MTEGSATHEKSKDDPLIGQVIGGRYRVQSLIARGGMGKVYRAEQEALGRRVAIKVLNVEARQDDEMENSFQKRFVREAATCAQLTHPNTLTVFDYGTEEGIYYIVMEYLEGRSLRDVIRAEAPFSVPRTFHIVEQIARSLREAHSQGVIHRDLKSANIFLLPQEGEHYKEFVKVLDFGLVKQAETREESLTQTGMFMGTPKYMAPEQIRGAELDGRADVYALGVIMYEMLTGSPPFVEKSDVDILHAHIRKPVPPFSEKNPNVEHSPLVEEFVWKALAKDPEERFSSMGQLLATLQQISGAPSSADTGTFNSLGLTPSHVGPAATQERQQPLTWFQRHQRVSVAVALSVGLVAMGGVYAWMEGSAADGGGQNSQQSASEGSESDALQGDGEEKAGQTGDETTKDASAGDATTDAGPEWDMLVTLKSDPAGAYVLVSQPQGPETARGPTPVQLEWTGQKAKPGRDVTFKFHKEGYRGTAVKRTIEEGEDLVVKAELKKIVDRRAWRKRRRRRNRRNEQSSGNEGQQSGGNGSDFIEQPF